MAHGEHSDPCSTGVTLGPAAAPRVVAHAPILSPCLATAGAAARHAISRATCRGGEVERDAGLREVREAWCGSPGLEPMGVFCRFGLRRSEKVSDAEAVVTAGLA